MTAAQLIPALSLQVGWGTKASRPQAFVPAQTTLHKARAPVLQEKASGMRTSGRVQVYVDNQYVLLALSARARTTPSGVQRNDSPAKVSEPSAPTRLQSPMK